ncbi:MAG: transglutaminase domain-containing protein [Lachnospiraceae bacterium]|nr:transglutaminase domain-containing protein [Lachnospiraceae bacterium]
MRKKRAYEEQDFEEDILDLEDEPEDDLEYLDDQETDLEYFNELDRIKERPKERTNEKGHLEHQKVKKHGRQPEKKTARSGHWFLKAVIFLLCIALLGGGGYLFYSYDNAYYHQAVTETGTEIVASDFMKDQSLQVEFAPDNNPVDVTVPSEYRIKLQAGMIPFFTKLTIQDTVPPTGEVQDVVISLGESISPEQFFASVQDVTRTTVAFTETPDVSAYGIYPVSLLLTDAGGNTTTYEATLTIPQTVTDLDTEAGGELPDLSDFLLEKGTNASFVTDVATIPLSEVADYPVEIQVDGTTYVTNLHVVDTTPPVGEVQDLEAFTTSVLQASDFVVSTEDLFPVTASFEAEPDYSKTGEQTVQIKLSDPSGNSCVRSAKLTLAVDTEPPKLTGVKDIVAFTGGTISYKSGVSVTDNCDTDIEFKVDQGSVKPDTVGKYLITYTATDRAGNMVSQDAYVDVRLQEYDLTEIDAMADEVLAKITTADMSDYEKAHAIFKWIKGNIGYKDSSQKDNWLQGAYEGLKNHTGDCYVYAMTSKELLTRAGITNMDIMKIPRSHDHFWNLVDVGTGWLHFDTTPRVSDHPDIFLWTDEELMTYSGQHFGSHNYDKTQYPEITGTKPEEAAE